jgi:hypothetical protein
MTDSTNIVAGYLLNAVAPWRDTLLSLQQMFICVAVAADRQGITPDDVTNKDGQATLEAIAMTLNFPNMFAWPRAPLNISTMPMSIIEQWFGPKNWWAVICTAGLNPHGIG